MCRSIQKKSGAQPVLIQLNAFEDGALRHRLILSPKHRILLGDTAGQEVLAPAKAFVGLKGLRHMRGRQEIEYISILFDRHHILDVSGLAAESFLPGLQGQRLLSARERAEVRQVLTTCDTPMAPARPCLGGSEGQRALAAGGRPQVFPRLRLVKSSLRA